MSDVDREIEKQAQAISLKAEVDAALACKMQMSARVYETISVAANIPLFSGLNQVQAFQEHAARVRGIKEPQDRIQEVQLRPLLADDILSEFRELQEKIAEVLQETRVWQQRLVKGLDANPIGDFSQRLRDLNKEISVNFLIPSKEIEAIQEIQEAFRKEVEGICREYLLPQPSKELIDFTYRKFLRLRKARRERLFRLLKTLEKRLEALLRVVSLLLKRMIQKKSSAPTIGGMGSPPSFVCLFLSKLKIPDRFTLASQAA